MMKIPKKFKLIISLITLLVSTVLFLNAQPFYEIAKLAGDSLRLGDRMGYILDMSGDYMVAGVPKNQLGTYPNAINGTGGVFIFKRNSSGEWTQVQYLIASDAQKWDEFGSSVAISDNFMIVGAQYEDYENEGNTILNTGAAYLFEKDENGLWQEVQKIGASDKRYHDLFGKSVAIYESPNTMDAYALVGAPSRDYISATDTILNVGACYIFKRTSTGAWVEITSLMPTDGSSGDWFGGSLALYGQTAVISSTLADLVTPSDTIIDAGAVYVFNRDNMGNWIESEKIQSIQSFEMGQFGHALAISEDQILIGTPYEDEDTTRSFITTRRGLAYTYYKNVDNQWVFGQRFIPEDTFGMYHGFGESVSISGDLAVVGSRNTHFPELGTVIWHPYGIGSAFIYRKRASGLWEEVQQIYASDPVGLDNFGSSVAVSGTYVVAGSPYADQTLYYGLPFHVGGKGVAYMFELCQVHDTHNPVVCRDYMSMGTGKVYTSSGIYMDTIRTWSTCDSIIAINLTVVGEDITVNEINACDSHKDRHGNLRIKDEIYYDTLKTKKYNCDSIVVTDLKIENIDENILFDGTYLYTNTSNANYQWIDCNNDYSDIPNEKQPYFQVSVSGDYAVKIDKNSCSKMSDCYSLKLENGTFVPSDRSASLRWTQNAHHIMVGFPYQTKADVELLDLAGRRILTFTSGLTQKVELDLQGISEGAYILRVVTGGGLSQSRIFTIVD